ncbi:factor H binding protein domain-containing protein [Mannheimia haemolytica]|uniref:factor H binding protein domain-containing protein n=1 Tax=Mannheimia haemolytica TaxID=75985 RepID=UPI002EB068C6|nr:factor H binding protein domain-containing protein [Mannheimia haemolytica]
MSIKKLTLATLILVGLTACGSSGSGSSANNANSNKPKIVTPKDKVDQAKDKDKAKAEEAKKIIDAKGIDDQQYGLKEPVYSTTENNGSTIRSTSSLYNQPYSVVTAKMVMTFGENESRKLEPSVEVKGLKTEKLPIEGNAVYKGKAFDANGSKGSIGGDLTYKVDFGTRKGSGEVVNALGGSIKLNEGQINSNGLISSSAAHIKNEVRENGTYEIQFFGPEAQEIGGKIEINGEGEGPLKQTLGIVGTREDKK